MSAFAQQGDSASALKVTNKIERITDKLHIKLAVTNDIETFETKVNGSNYIISPHSSVVSHLFVNYRLISFSISYTPRFIPGNGDNNIRGTTHNFGTGFGFNIRRFYNDLSYSHTKGYYLKNTPEYVPNWKHGDPYIQFPNLVANSIEGLAGYKFNRQFSQIALTSQTERQVKSAGSFIPKLYYRYYIVDDRSGGANTQKTNNFLVIAGAGYHYTFVAKKCFYLSLGLTPGYGIILTRLLTRAPAGNVLENKQTTILQLDGMSAIGYNGNRIFTGMWVSSSFINYHQENTTAVNTDSKIYYQVFLGYRFNAPKLVKNTYDRMWKKMEQDKRVKKYIKQ